MVNYNKLICVRIKLKAEFKRFEYKHRSCDWKKLKIWKFVEALLHIFNRFSANELTIIT